MDSSDVEDVSEFGVVIGTDINYLCRICSRSDENLIAIFQNEFESLANKIMTYLPVKITADDILPVKVCALCTDMILKWDKFYQSCVDVDKRFQAILSEEKLDENLTFEIKEKYEDVTKEETENTLNQESVTINSISTEDVFDKMDVSSVREEPQIVADDMICPSSVEEASNEIVQTSKRNRIFKNRQLEICPFCKTKAKTKDILSEHLKRKHADEIFHCEICNYLKPRNELISHMTNHALETLKKSTNLEKNKEKLKTQLTCSKCDKIFSNLSGMRYHMNAVHAKVKQHKCELCEKLFACERILLNHKRSIHQKERTFKCNICSKTFKTDSTLFSHKKIHSENYPYKCETCDKQFKFKHHLVTHSAQHTSEKNFLCVICHKSFSIQNNLSKHLKTHSTTLDFGCHICGVRMKQRRYLQEHMKRVHQTTLAASSSK